MTPDGVGAFAADVARGNELAAGTVTQVEPARPASSRPTSLQVEAALSWAATSTFRGLLPFALATSPQVDLDELSATGPPACSNPAMGRPSSENVSIQPAHQDNVVR